MKEGIEAKETILVGIQAKVQAYSMVVSKLGYESMDANLILS